MFATERQIADYYERHRFDGSREIDCPNCNGQGVFYSDNGPSPSETECEWCSGSGFVDQPQ